VFLSFIQRFLCFVLKIKFTIAENNKTLVTTLYFPSRSFSFLLYALCLSGFQHQTLFYLWICCFLPKSLCDDVSNAATLADGMAVARQEKQKNLSEK
jgi:hypothetical protein